MSNVIKGLQKIRDALRAPDAQQAINKVMKDVVRLPHKSGGLINEGQRVEGMWLSEAARVERAALDKIKQVHRGGGFAGRSIGPDGLWADKPLRPHPEGNAQSLIAENHELRKLNEMLIAENAKLQEAAKRLRLEMDKLQLQLGGRDDKDMEVLNRAADFFTPQVRR